MKNIETKQKEFVAVAKEMFGENTTQVSRKDVVQMINTKGVQYPVWLLKSPTYEEYKEIKRINKNKKGMHFNLFKNIIVKFRVFQKKSPRSGLILVLFLFFICINAAGQHSTTLSKKVPEYRKISVEEYINRAKAGWIGQMAGVGWGAPTEFKWKGEIIPEKMLRGHMLNLHYVHLGHGGEHHEDDGHKGGKENGEGHEGGDGVHSSESKPSAKEADLHFSKDHVAITVPRDKIKFMGNHGPRYGNYYALYFTMTALHGLHVVGGALVLLYFVVFGTVSYTHLTLPTNREV